MEQTAELYQVVRAQARLETAAFVERYVDLPHAEDGCRGCPNVGQYWTCPPYAFPAAAYWGRFREIELIGQQMHFSDAALAKMYPPEELEELERAVLVRQARLLADEVLPAAPEGSALLTVGGVTIDPEQRVALKDGQVVELTAKEYDLIELFVKNPRRVYSRENLMDLVWGYTYAGDYRTVDVHIRRLREKLEDDPAAPQHILTKWGIGYYFKD